MYELINDVQIKVKEYKGQRVVTFKDIDTVHNRPVGTAKKRFNDNKKRFVEGEDYFKVCWSEFRTNKDFDISPKTHRDIIFLTESGYLMLVKSFTDDLSWSVQRQLVKTYFRSSKIISSNNDAVIIEKLELIEHKIDMLEKEINTLDKNSKSRTENIIKTLFDISNNIIVTSFEFIYNKFFR
ncbi:MAG: ORF6N domain-containing protein [Prevotella sp.]|nr:ORF6N domain-containing protein [Alistipes senegalensis]MCM1357355.1 ORF6N domain-containing protein [Prevotella sp.]MCM1472503.1 ORF6N domain-containing protein [Muribaculaceae bacterium]